MARARRQLGWMGWTFIIAALLAAGALGLWRWAVATQSVWLLDRADALATSGLAETSAPISYGNNPEQEVVVTTPTERSAGPRPVVLFIHGGSWSHGHAPDYAYVGRNLAADGFVGVSAGYRLVPGGEYPAMLEDGAAAVRWVTDNIARYGGDPARIYLMGHSAGAYNAVMLALDRRWLDRAGVPQSSIRAAIGLAGPYDFLPLDSEGTINAFGKAADLAATQPIRFVRADAPPLLLLTGDADTTVRPRNSFALAKALEQAGRPTEPVVFQGMTHAGIVLALSRLFAGDGGVKGAVADFIARQEAQSSGDIQAASR